MPFGCWCSLHPWRLLLFKKKVRRSWPRAPNPYRLDQQPALYIKAAHLQLKDADTHYEQGKIEDATNDVRLISEYADKASDTSIRSGKKLKDAEIEIRKIATRLKDIQHTLSFDDQAPVKTTVEHLEDLRTKLLARMFSKDKKK